MDSLHCMALREDENVPYGNRLDDLRLLIESERIASA